MPKITKQISEKNTKSEILQAYEDLMLQLGEGVELTKKEVQEQAIVEKAASETTEKIISELARVKISLNQAIDSLSDSLTSEAEKLTDVRKAVTVSQRELESSFQIKARAEMLKKLFEAYSQKQADLEKEIAGKHKNWEEEQREYEEGLKRKRQREEDEYKYQVDLEKRRWSQKLEEEKEVYKQKLVELEELKKQTALFPQEREKAILEAVGKALAEEKKLFEVEKSFTKQESDTALKIAGLKISQLEAIVKEQAGEILELKK